MDGERSSISAACCAPVAARPVGPSRHYLLLGICGAGMRALAEILLEAGHRVTGTDSQIRSTADVWQQRAAWQSLRPEFCDWGSAVSVIRSAAGAGVHSAEHVDQVVASAAVPESDARLQAAAELGVPRQLLSQAVADCFRGQQQLCVAGTHGKSTTTGLLWWLLQSAGQQPGGYIGGQLRNLSRSGFRGAAAGPRRAVLESCEYRHAFLSLDPQTIILTGIDRDHFDCFPDAGAEDCAFAEFIARLPATGQLILNGDCPRALRLGRAAGRTLMTTGLSADCVWRAVNIQTHAAGTEFDVLQHGRLCGRLSTGLPGLHNVRNVLAAVAAAAAQGVAVSQLAAAVADYRGIQRRIERRGQWAGMELIDDYAHHPGAIAASLSAVRQMYPGRRVLAVFEPHQLSRTEQLFEQFCRVLVTADECLILPVLAARESVGYAECCRASGRLVRQINLAGGRAFLLANLDQVLARIDHAGRPGDVVVTMGAGRTNQIHDEFNRRLHRDFVA